MKNSTTEWATIGTVVAPFGLRGELKVYSLTDIPDRFVTLEKVYLSTDERPHRIETVRPYKGEMLILKFADISNVTAAETLRNATVRVPLDELPALPPDSYYQHDILGLQVLKMDGQSLGSISDIITTGSNDVYVVKTPVGKEHLIPAVKDVIKQVDLIRRVMYIEPMIGLLDDDSTLANATEEEEEK